MSRGSWAATALVLLLATTPGRAEVVDRILVTIDGEPITAHEVELYAQERGADPSQVPGQQLLESLVNERLLAREAKVKGIEVTDAEVDRAVEEMRSRGGFDQQRFEQALAAQGMTLESYRARLRTEIARQQLIAREIRGRVTISPEEIERHYETHKDDYLDGERVTLRDIVLPLPPNVDIATATRIAAFAEQIRARAAAGEDFGALAKAFSQGPGAKDGGLLGTFTKGQLTPELDQAAFALARGEVSPVIRTATGLHILRADDKTGDGRAGIDQVRDDIREKLYEETLEKRFAEWLTKDLRERHHVEVID